MPRKSSLVTKTNLKKGWALFLQLPVPLRWGVGVILAVGGLLYYGNMMRDQLQDAKASQITSGDGSVLFCFWNVENLFDDKDDKRNNIDETYDNPFAQDEKLRNLKLDRIASTLIQMNDGKGPDVMAFAELESIRALELLKATLNNKLTAANVDAKYQYKYLAMKNLNGGRHIATGVIARYNLVPQLTKQLGRNLRILETHLYVNNKDLCIISSHWTSQLKQRDGSDGDSGRENYANSIYEAYRDAMKKNPNSDVLICGDFNDSPNADPIFKNLGAIGDKAQVKATDNEPFLFNLMANKDPNKFGTIYYGGKPLIYDQICISPGLLDDKGWTCEIDTVHTYTQGLIARGATRREPWRFGNPDRDTKASERGYSDHFPVIVRLKVEMPMNPKDNEPEPTSPENE